MENSQMHHTVDFGNSNLTESKEQSRANLNFNEPQHHHHDRGNPESNDRTDLSFLDSRASVSGNYIFKKFFKSYLLLSYLNAIHSDFTICAEIYFKIKLNLYLKV